jgi:hypothetical protein
MKRRTALSAEPRGRLRLVPDTLPHPRELVPREDSVQVTCALSREAAEFFRVEAAQTKLPVHRLLRRVLEAYASECSSGEEAAGRRAKGG